MPLFDYKCKHCQQITEMNNKIEVAVIKCPHCGEEAKRIISKGGTFILKGSGFYSKGG